MKKVGLGEIWSARVFLCLSALNSMLCMFELSTRELTKIYHFNDIRNLYTKKYNMVLIRAYIVIKSQRLVILSQKSMWASRR